MASPRCELAIALIGPVVNLGLAGAAQAVRLALLPTGPLDMVLVLLVLGNLAAAVMSLVPFGASDGARIVRALRARGCQ
jgi:Zn-dependent protease